MFVISGLWKHNNNMEGTIWTDNTCVYSNNNTYSNLIVYFSGTAVYSYYLNNYVVTFIFIVCTYDIQKCNFITMHYIFASEGKRLTDFHGWDRELPRFLHFFWFLSVFVSQVNARKTSRTLTKKLSNARGCSCVASMAVVVHQGTRANIVHRPVQAANMETIVDPGMGKWVQKTRIVWNRSLLHVSSYLYVVKKKIKKKHTIKIFRDPLKCVFQGRSQDPTTVYFLVNFL